jgi:predicted nucleic acid-binding protein
MIPAPFRVVLDANVLFPLTLRDTLLRAAEAGLYQLYWSEEILEETRRNLVRTARMTEDQAARLVRAMRAAFPEALVSGYEPLIASMTNEADDRHVAAAALKAGAQVIVTSNLRDFQTLPEGIEAQSPDDFLCNLFDLDPDGFIERLLAQASAMKRPPVAFEDLLQALAKAVPDLSTAVRAHLKPKGDLEIDS